MRSRLHPTLIAGALLAVLLCAEVYRQSLSFGFVPLDDDQRMLLNAHLGGPSVERLSWMFGTTGFSGYYMPLGWLALSLLFPLAGLHPAPYHAALVALHALNAVLLFALLRRLLPRLSPPAPGLRVEPVWTCGCALLGSLWWTLNPLRVESVAWISGLSYAQAVSFALAAVLVYVGPAAPAPAASGRRLTAAGLLYTASLLTYPIALGLLPVFFVLDGFGPQASGREPGSSIPSGAAGIWVAIRRRLTGKILLVAVTAAVAAVSVAGTRRTTAHFHLAASDQPASIRLARAAYALSYYLAKPWVPTNLNVAYPATLAPDPAHPETAGRAFWNPALVAGVAASAGIALVCVLAPRLRRRLGLGPLLACHVCLLLPMLGLALGGDYMTCDRYCCLASMLGSVVIALLLLRTPARARFAAGLLVCVYLSLLGLGSRTQALAWRDADALWAHIAATLGPRGLPDLQYGRRGTYLDLSGRYDEADAVARRGLAVVPDDPALLSLRRDILSDRVLARDCCPMAEIHLQQARRFVRSGDWHEADEHLRLALELSPGYAPAAYDRALVLLQLGRPRDALHAFLRAEACSPTPFSSAQRLAVLGPVRGALR